MAFRFELLWRFADCLLLDWREEDCLEEDFLFEALLFPPPRLALLALLEAEWDLFMEAPPPREALWRILWAKQSSGITRARVNKKAQAVIIFL